MTGEPVLSHSRRFDRRSESSDAPALRPRTMPRSPVSSPARASTSKPSPPRSPPSPSPCRPGASARAARALRAFPVRASRAAFSISSRIARRSTSSPARRQPARPHFPWDKVSDYRELAELAKALGVGFDAVNSNTFQDQPGQTLSYKFGSLTHSEKAVRDQAVAHNIECIEIGEKLGSKALTVWIADGSNFPGQSNLNRVFDWYLGIAGRDLRAAARPTGGCFSSTSSTSRPSIRPSFPTGARA